MLLCEPRALLDGVDADLAWRHLRVYFQPIVDREGRVRKAETLLRLEHPTRGLMPASLFLERLLTLGYPIASQVCRTLMALDPHPPIRVTINLETDDLLNPDTLDAVSRLARRLSLEVEISERGPFPDILPAALLEGIRHLRQAGCRVSLDDFGAGVSSLKLLPRLRDHLDGIKLDKWWVQQATDPIAASIAQLLIDAANAAGLEVTAEGVETAEHAAWAYHAGCDYAQGWWIGRPQAHLDP